MEKSKKSKKKKSSVENYWHKKKQNSNQSGEKKGDVGSYVKKKKKSKGLSKPIEISSSYKPTPVPFDNMIGNTKTMENGESKLFSNRSLFSNPNSDWAPTERDFENFSRTPDTTGTRKLYNYGNTSKSWDMFSKTHNNNLIGRIMNFQSDSKSTSLSVLRSFQKRLNTQPSVQRKPYGTKSVSKNANNTDSNTYSYQNSNIWYTKPSSSLDEGERNLYTGSNLYLYQTYPEISNYPDSMPDYFSRTNLKESKKKKAPKKSKIFMESLEKENENEKRNITKLQNENEFRKLQKVESQNVEKEQIETLTSPKRVVHQNTHSQNTQHQRIVPSPIQWFGDANESNFYFNTDNAPMYGNLPNTTQMTNIYGKMSSNAIETVSYKTIQEFGKQYDYGGNDYRGRYVHHRGREFYGGKSRGGGYRSRYRGGYGGNGKGRYDSGYGKSSSGNFRKKRGGGYYDVRDPLYKKKKALENYERNDKNEKKNPTRSLFVRAVPNDTRDVDIAKIFGNFGEIRELFSKKLPSKGFVIVHYYDIRDSKSAFNKADEEGIYVNGKMVKVHYSYPKEKLMPSEINCGVVEIVGDNWISLEQEEKFLSSFGKIEKVVRLDHGARKIVSYFDIRSAMNLFKAMSSDYSMKLGVRLLPPEGFVRRGSVFIRLRK